LKKIQVVSGAFKKGDEGLGINFFFSKRVFLGEEGKVLG
jgi:hypothetical protein